MHWGFIKFVVNYTLIILVSVISTVTCDGGNVLGCGGFIKSHVQIDFSKIEVKLLTRQGILKDKTSCAPNNGYYFVPIYDTGEYILQLEPPAGWSFTPAKIHINIDGVSDICSQGKDINFVFKGFGITGKVESLGKNQGPAGVTVELQSSTDKKSTITSEGGDFFFTPVYPGKYHVSISHPKWKITKQSVDVTVTKGNTELPPNSLIIQGYDVRGTTRSDGAPVKDAKILLFSQDGKSNIPVDGCLKELNSPYHRNMLCYVKTDDYGVYLYPTVPPGKYFIKPFFENQNIYFEPESIEFEVSHGTVNISTSFKMVGFSVMGRVRMSENGAPVPKARVFLNGVETAMTDSKGFYKLEWVKVGSYNIKVEDDNLEFEEVSVNLNPNILQLPDILPSKYKVCGTVISDEIELISFDDIETGRHDTTESDPTTGKFCKLLSAGIYTVQVDIGGRDNQKGLQFFPVSQTVVVPSDDLNIVAFSQLKATISGQVKCLTEKDCLNLKVSIKPEFQDNKQENNEIRVPVKNYRYTIEDISPGNYKLILHSNKLCWEGSEHKITVNSATVTAPLFIQTGYSVIFVSSHDTQVSYKLPDEKSQMLQLDIPKGRSVKCVAKPGSYVFQLNSCHTYESDKISFQTNSNNEIFLNALQHQTRLAIKANENYGNLFVDLQTEQGKKQIGPFVYEKSHYNLQLLLSDGETVTVIPRSDFLYFLPISFTFKGTDDCQDLGTKFEAKKGKVIKGQVIPPLSDVKITIQGEGLEQLTTTTDHKGYYRFPPLDSSKDYKINAQKDSYIFSGPTKDGDFSAHKLAEILVEVIDETAKTPLQGALISLSGEQSYRSNFKTDKLGKIKFTSLNRGEYFLRPMMKEYSFVPSSKMINIKEGEVVELVLMGRRVAYSAFGTITSLRGEPEKDVTIVAEGVGNCSQFSEESTSEYSGQFRIRGLQPFCSYNLKVKDGNEEPYQNKRSVPNAIHIEKMTEDVKDLKMIIFRPFGITELLIKVYSENPEYYKTLKLLVSRESPSYSLVHTLTVNTTLVKLTKYNNPGVMIHGPAVPLDDSVYSVQVDSSLPSNKWNLQTKYFTANSSLKYLDFNFTVQTNVSEQQIKDTSLWALIMIFTIALVVYKIDVIVTFVRQNVFFNLPTITSSNIKKNNNGGYSMDNADIDQIVENINATKRKPKSKKL